MFRLKQKITIIAVVFAALAALLLAVSGCGSSDAAGDASSGQTNANAPRQAPDFNVVLLDGGMISLSDLRAKGKPIILNFGASWCDPCKLEAPVLAQMYNKYKDQLTFQGFAVKDAPSDAKAFVDSEGLAYPTGLDPQSDVAYEYQIAAKVPAAGIPMTIFIRTDGTIADYYLGPLTEKTFEQRLAKILPPPPATGTTGPAAPAAPPAGNQ